MILLWGSSEDPPLRAVYEALASRGATVLPLDRATLGRCGFELRGGRGLHATLWLEDRTVDLDTVRAVYLRPESPSDAQGVDPVREALAAWAETAAARVVHRPSTAGWNHTKPAQLHRLAAMGFAVPETVVTSDPAVYRDFLARHGEVVLKGASGERTRVRRLRPQDQQRLELLRWCPVLLQRYVPGRDHRVHVVGDEVFACEVRSAEDDYRYPTRAGTPTAVRECSLPPELVARCMDAVRALGLHLAGVDLRLGDDGVWYVLEVNPSPGITWFAEATGQPIADAVADLLLRG